MSGPAAATEATVRALEQLSDPRAVVLVEGVSDQVAVDTVAGRSNRVLEAGRVAVVPIGGAQAIDTFLDRFSRGDGAVERIIGLCDAAGAPRWGQAFDRHNAVTASGDDAATASFHVCTADLEDELIRAVGTERVVELLDEHGDLRPFRTLQKQAAWLDRPVAAQVHRFIGSGARRKLRYAAVLAAESVVADRVPAPLSAVLAAAFDE